MKTILVPTDLSPLADSALQVAADLARTHGAEIVLVHHLPFSMARASTEDLPDMAKYLDKQEAKAKADMQRLAESPVCQGIPITQVLSQHTEGLYEAVTKRQSDLIVLATHGAAGWDEWLFGSNAEHIVRLARCPVLVLKHAVSPFAPKNAIAAIDVDDALKQHWPVYPFDEPGSGLKQFVYVSTPSDSRVPEGVQDWMRELAREKGIADYELHIRHARSVEDGILNYARERQADLIVLFTHGHTGLRHLLQGSVAEDILNHASVPVLIMRANG